jgi:hypothetical protein
MPIRNLTWNIGPKNHGPASQVRGAKCGGKFLGATDLGTRSVLEGISIQNHFFENESVLVRNRTRLLAIALGARPRIVIASGAKQCPTLGDCHVVSLLAMTASRLG